MRINSVQNYYNQTVKSNMSFGKKTEQKNHVSPEYNKVLMQEAAGIAALTLLISLLSLAPKNNNLQPQKKSVTELSQYIPQPELPQQPVEDNYQETKQSMQVYRRERDENIMPEAEGENDLDTANLDIEG
ncbi:MAG TPA: hypothetical protein PLG15_01505 [Candidatus Gastranaerophilaceae bacterium]|nr:hypothetical protein [Candidatus Gastranaerophilaceae bacterium]HPT41043.1 hypothetical protein [Candidatus Gastranaerophilaceae bacterium]